MTADLTDLTLLCLRRYTLVCPACCAGWQSMASVGTCPHCGDKAQCRGVTKVAELLRPPVESGTQHTNKETDTDG